MNVFLNRFSSAKPNGPGVPGAGDGDWVSCLTILVGRARKGTLSGAPQTAAAKLRPLLPTLFAAVTAGSPIPVAISRTLSPGLVCTSSTNLLLIFWAPFSNVLHQFFHPSDTLFQL